jgi:uncharacterized protein (DUF2062 family)
LAGVLEGLAIYNLPVVVVNDGATDGTAEVLERWRTGCSGGDPNSRIVQTHSTNRGKADALRTGFAEAARLGCTHAATIDTDGQHDTADLAQLLELCTREPGALVVGARIREGSHAPAASRVGRVLSNGLVWVESGVSVTDSQSGMRVYPLAHMAGLEGRASRYGFETEVLTRAGWLGVPVIETPIRCVYRVEGGRTTHFQLGPDTLASAGMHLRLLARAHLPGPVRVKGAGSGDAKGELTGTLPGRLARWFSPRRLKRMAQGDAASRERLAASVGVGLVMATLPVYGVKTVVCLWLAGRFRLHPLAVIGVSSLSTPPLGLVFVAVSIFVGGLLLHGRVPDYSAVDLQSAALGELVVEWLVGSVVAGAALGLLGYAAVRAMLMRGGRKAGGRGAQAVTG